MAASDNGADGRDTESAGAGSPGAQSADDGSAGAQGPTPPTPEWPEDSPAPSTSTGDDELAGVRVPDSPAELTDPSADGGGEQLAGRDVFGRDRSQPRNFTAWLSTALGAGGLLLVLLTGAPLGLFLSALAVSFGVSSWVRVRRGMATALRPAQAGIVLAVAAIALSLFWSQQAKSCQSEAGDQEQLRVCVEDRTGLL